MADLFGKVRVERVEAFRVTVREQPYDTLCACSEDIRPARAEAGERIRTLAARPFELGRERTLVLARRQGGDERAAYDVREEGGGFVAD